MASLSLLNKKFHVKQLYFNISIHKKMLVQVNLDIGIVSATQDFS